MEIQSAHPMVQLSELSRPGAKDAALEVRDLKKRYGSTIALNRVSFSVAAGSVHALLGENGAGKSTLVKMLSGLAKPDSGSLSLFGAPVTIDGPRSAHLLGIQTAFQEISLVKDLTVAQNFLLAKEPLNFIGSVARRRSEEFVRAELDRLGLPEINPRSVTRDLDLPTRQKIEIARSVSRDPRLLLLDEPTASLSAHDVQWLARLIEEQKAAAATIIFISHRMQEVREFCSSLSILRNGECVATSDVASLSDDVVIEMMIGRSLSAAFPEKRPFRAGELATPVFGAKDLCVGEALKGVDLKLWPGQVIGVGGLQGMGQRELFLALFGALPLDGGVIELEGRPIALRSPADAVAAGIGLVPEDRKTEGLFLEFDGRDNLSLPALDRFLKLGLVDTSLEKNAITDVFKQIQIPARALTGLAAQFSGGNQQKMVIGRWLLAECRVLLLYDPTRGVDVGTKAEIYRLVYDYAAGGGAVLLYSSDIAELYHLCAEVIVLYRGRVGEILSGDAISEAGILRAALGGASASSKSVVSPA